MLGKIKVFSRKAIFLCVLSGFVFIIMRYYQEAKQELEQGMVSQHDMLNSTLLPSLSQNNNGFINRMAMSVIKPLLEQRIDYYLRKVGIMSYIQKGMFDDDILEIRDIKIGTGMPVQCGESVDIEWEKIGSGGVLNVDNFRLGFGKIDKFLQWGIIGMKKGGQRIITIPAIANNGTSINYQVRLTGIRGDLPKSAYDIRVFNDVIGNRRAALCGDSVSISYSVYDIRGNLLYDNDQKMKFQIGDRSVPLGIELGSIRMQKGTRRTLIVSKDLLQNVRNNTKQIEDQRISLGEELLLVDIYNE